MRVLVPYSGLGTNSTYGMYRWLTETDYEVVAMFLDIYYSSDEYTSFEREHFHRGVKWFKDNIRDFETIEKRCERLYPDAYEPVRKNFTLNMETGSYRNMRKVFIDTAKEYKVDFISSGKSGEDSNGALSKAVSISKGSGYDYIHPSWSLTEPVTLKNRDQVVKEMSAKWSQREKLPQELRNIITDCICKGNKGLCYCCTDLLLNEVRPETGQELDDIILEKLCAGKFRHLADPKTFQLNQRTATYLKLLGYNKEPWGDPIAEKELRNRARDMYAKAGNI